MTAATTIGEGRSGRSRGVKYQLEAQNELESTGPGSQGTGRRTIHENRGRLGALLRRSQARHLDFPKPCVPAAVCAGDDPVTGSTGIEDPGCRVRNRSLGWRTDAAWVPGLGCGLL